VFFEFSHTEHQAVLVALPINRLGLAQPKNRLLLLLQELIMRAFGITDKLPVDYSD
jgi:hypothetical protein